MCRGSEVNTVDVGIGFIFEQCLDDLKAAPEDCDAQRHFSHFMKGVGVYTSVEKKLNGFYWTGLRLRGG